MGTLNNLLYAKTISPQARKEANKIIRESLWLDYNAFDSWFVKNGTIENCASHSRYFSDELDAQFF